MSVRTIYTCDKCGSEHDSAKGFWRVGIMASPYDRPSSYTTTTTGAEMQVCRPCLESFGIFAKKKEIEDGRREPTLEEKIIDILNHLGVHAAD